MKKVKRTGRPTKRATPGTRVSLGLKVTAEAKARLEEAAAASGRTQSQEAEVRIEKSFDREGLLTEVISLAYGRPLAGILMLIADVMKDVGPMAAVGSGGGFHATPNWHRNPFAFDQAAKAAATILEFLRPAGATTPPTKSIAEIGESLARSTIEDVISDGPIFERQPGLRAQLDEAMIESIESNLRKRSR